MEVYNNELVEIDLKESFYFLLHKLWLIGIVGILFAVCTALVNVYLLPPVYTSTSKIYMISQQRDDELTVANSGTGSQLTNDSIKLVKDRAVMERVIQELKLDLSPDELDQRVNVDIAQDSSAIEINVVYSNPIMAKKNSGYNCENILRTTDPGSGNRKGNKDRRRNPANGTVQSKFKKEGIPGRSLWNSFFHSISCPRASAKWLSSKY